MFHRTLFPFGIGAVLLDVQLKAGAFARHVIELRLWVMLPGLRTLFSRPMAALIASPFRAERKSRGNSAKALIACAGTMGLPA